MCVVMEAAECAGGKQRCLCTFPNQVQGMCRGGGLAGESTHCACSTHACCRHPGGWRMLPIHLVQLTCTVMRAPNRHARVPSALCAMIVKSLLAALISCAAGRGGAAVGASMRQAAGCPAPTAPGYAPAAPKGALHPPWSLTRDW